MKQLGDIAIAENPRCPVIVFGHSMGSGLTQCHSQNNGHDFAGAILCRTLGSPLGLGYDATSIEPMIAQLRQCPEISERISITRRSRRPCTFDRQTSPPAFPFQDTRRRSSSPHSFEEFRTRQVANGKPPIPSRWRHSYRIPCAASHSPLPITSLSTPGSSCPGGAGSLSRSGKVARMISARGVAVG
jgi:pimeloyl-ACP methyl ester carboxylesterase